MNVADPRVLLCFTSQNPTQEKSSVNATLVDAICKVDVSVGTPEFTISYNGTESKTFQIINQERRLESYGYYQNGSYMTTLVIPCTGEIVCTVRDDLGRYTARKTISTACEQGDDNDNNDDGDGDDDDGANDDDDDDDDDDDGGFGNDDEDDENDDDDDYESFVFVGVGSGWWW